MKIEEAKTEFEKFLTEANKILEITKEENNISEETEKEVEVVDIQSQRSILVWGSSDGDIDD